MFLSNSIEVRHTWAEKINKERESGASAKATRLSSTVAVKSEKGRAMRRVKLVSLRNFLYKAFDFSVCRPMWRLRRRTKRKKSFYTWRISCQRRYSGFVPFVLLINTEAKLPLQKCCWVRLPPREREILEVDHSWNLIQVCAAERGTKSLPIWNTA